MLRKKCACGKVLHSDINKCPSCGEMMVFIGCTNEEFLSHADEDITIEDEVKGQPSPFILAERLAIQGKKEAWTLDELISELTNHWNELE